MAKPTSFHPKKHTHTHTRWCRCVILTTPRHETRQTLRILTGSSRRASLAVCNNSTDYPGRCPGRWVTRCIRRFWPRCGQCSHRRWAGLRCRSRTGLEQKGLQTLWFVNPAPPLYVSVQSVWSVSCRHVINTLFVRQSYPKINNVQFSSVILLLIDNKKRSCITTSHRLHKA